MSVKTRRVPYSGVRPKWSSDVHPEPAVRKPTGQLIAAKRRREWAAVKGWLKILGLSFLLMIVSINGNVLFNLETKRRTDLQRQIEQERQRNQQIITLQQQLSSPTKVMQWASKAGLVRAEEQPTVVLKPVVTVGEEPAGSLDGSVLGTLPNLD